MKPVLSVVTVTFQAEAVLEATIQSVLGQTYPSIEYVIIDGGSTDKTVALIKQYDSQLSYWVSEPDQGLYDAMNKGIAAAKGEWICFLNAGDTFPSPTMLTDLFETVPPKAEFIYGDSYLLTHSGAPIRLLKAEFLDRKSISKGMIACHQTMWIKREKCPRYSLQLKYKADYNWVCDVLFRVEPQAIFKSSLCLVNYRMGGISESDFWNHFKEYLGIVRSRFGFKTVLWRIPRMVRRLANVYLKQRLLGIETLRFWEKK